MNLKSVLILFIHFFILISYSESQVNKWNWAKRYGAEMGINLNDCSTDNMGNYYVTGEFGGSINIESSILTSQGISDIYILKYDRNGDILYVKSFGGNDRDWAFGIDTDNNNNTFITGVFFSDSILFDDKVLYNTNDSGKMFILKMNTHGDVIWARGSSGTCYAKGENITSDSGGNAYVAGTFSSTSLLFDTMALQTGTSPDTVNGGAMYCETPDTMDESDYSGAGIFIVKYDSGGNAKWVKGIKGYGNVKDLATDKNNNIYLIGDFQSCSLLVGDTILYTKGVDDIFFIKLNEDGKLLQTFSLGGTSQDVGASVYVDDSLNVLFSGAFISDSIPIGSEMLFPYRIQNSIHSTSLLASLDLNGDIRWALRHPGSSTDLVIDKSGIIYEVGEFFFNTDFNVFSLNTNGEADIYLAKYSMWGGLEYVNNIGGECYEQSRSINLDGDNYFIGGYTDSDSIVLDNTVLLKRFKNDIFLASGKINSLIDGGYSVQGNIKSDFQIYPVPAQDYLIIESDEAIFKAGFAVLYNAMGQPLKQEYVNESYHRFDLSSVKPGLYFIKFSNAYSTNIHFKIIVE